MQDVPDAWVELPPRELLHELGVPTYHGFIPQMYRLVAAHPRIARRFAALSSEVMRGGEPSALSVAEREMVAAVTAAAQDCFY
jgi:alkylhydroperoxidase family enzyme